MPIFYIKQAGPAPICVRLWKMIPVLLGVKQGCVLGTHNLSCRVVMPYKVDSDELCVYFRIGLFFKHSGSSLMKRDRAIS